MPTAAGSEGAAAHDLFETRLRQVDAVVQNQDNREHDLLDSDDYYQFEGGLAAAVKHLSGAAPTVYHDDHSRPERPAIRTLDEEVSRVVRGPRRQSEMDRRRACATATRARSRWRRRSTTCSPSPPRRDAVRDHHFDAVFDAYLRDDAVRDSSREPTPTALREMSERLLEAQTRGLWKPRTNSTRELLHACARGESPIGVGESR